jgi:putative ABC transport system substrate-binding protein
MRRTLRQTALGSILFAGAVLAVALTVDAQQPKKIPRIGVLVPTSPSLYAARIKAFQQGLHEHGYIEGKNIMLEYRYAEGKVDRFPQLATELVGLKVDVIVTGPEGAVRAAKKASSTIPIVFASVSDPVGGGLVASLARPEGNATGLTIIAPELDGKRLELLKEAFPKVTRVAFFWRIGGPRGNLPFSDTEAVAKGLRVQLQPLGVRNVDDFAAAFETAKRIGIEAILTTPNPTINTVRDGLVDFAAKNRLPAMYATPEFVDAGGLMSYAPSYGDLFRRAATYVDKILKGAKPADLPVEQPTKFQLVINLKTASQIGLTIPQKVLTRADRVIK